MMRVALIVALTWFAGAPVIASPPTGSAAFPMVLNARIGEHGDYTRFVFELSDPVKFRVFTLSSPNRVVIDMPEVLWRLQAPDFPSGKGVVKDYRYGLFRPGDSRFIVDLNGPVTARAPVMLPPSAGMGYRLVLDLYPATQAKFEEAAGWPADLRAKESAAEHLASRAGVHNSARKIVVLDPGHGGIDAGTTGVDGTKEKDIVLDEARRLAKVLQKRGYIVHLTRDSDIYIPLRERVSIARSYAADLLVSLHADSNRDPRVAGASVYTLSDQGSDREAAALAKKENHSDIIAGVDLKGQDDTVSHILIDLAQRETINRSGRLAQMLVSELPRATNVISGAPHRSAAFAVLKAPDVPAVLIELGYLSNPHDCTQLNTETWRNDVARAIAAAVDRHFQPSSPGGAAAATAAR
ncbi:MAG TPA: N-acetylmuramoyl-L-alanine amidase [Rhizomicrobium sp.]